jgi:hypothetical protein
MKMLDKKGQIVANLQGFLMALVTIGVILAVGLYVLQELQTATLGADDGNSSTALPTTSASNATGEVITKLGQAPTWLGLLLTVVFASAVLAYFYFRR